MVTGKIGVHSASLGFKLGQMCWLGPARFPLWTRCHCGLWLTCLGLTCLGLACLGLACLGLACSPAHPSAEELCVALSTLLGQPRIALLRAASETPWTPCPQDFADHTAGFPQVACTPQPRTSSQRLTQLDRELRSRDTAHPTPELLHAAGLWRLFWFPQENAAAAAVELLERAAQLAPHDSAVANDLALAYALRGQERLDPVDLVRSLAALDTAIEQDPALAVARFNRARVLAWLGLGQSALAELQQFQRIGQDRSWSEEAQALTAELKTANLAPKIAALRHSLLDTAVSPGADILHAALTDYRELTRLAVEELLLVRWPAAVSNAVASGRELQRAGELARQLAAVGGDALLTEAVTVAEGAGAQQPAAVVAQVVNAHREFGRALALFEAGAYAQAAVLFAPATAALDRLGSPLGYWGAFYLATCRHMAREFVPAAADLEALLTAIQHAPYPVLRARTLWVLGLTYGVRGHLDQAIALHRRALDLLAQAGEGSNCAVVHFLLAENLQNLGEYRLAWDHRLRALRGVATVLRTYQRHNIYYEAADAIRRQGRPQIALHFYDEMVALHHSASDPISLTEALLRRARILDELDQPKAAQADLTRAGQVLAGVRDPATRHRLAADRELIAARSSSASDPQGALAQLTTARTFYLQSGLHRQQQQVLAARAAVHLRLGATEAARRDLEGVIADYEAQRASVADIHTRAATLDEVRGVFAQLALLHATHRNAPGQAFDVAERARALALLDLLAARKSALRRPLTHAEAAHRLPAGAVLVEYLVTAEETLIWTITAEGVELWRSAVTPARLQHWVDALDPSAGKRFASSDSTKILNQLYTLLIRPLSDRLAGARLLIIAPDGPLHRVPFAALRDPQTGTHLIERFPLLVTPSATAFALARERLQALGTAPPASLLAVADPQFRSTDYPGLERLPGAREEAQAVATVYPRATLLLGTAATKHRLLELTGTFDVLHVAAHAIVNPERPLQSRLVLAADEDRPGSGALGAHELYGRSFAHTRLVVLAACSTARGSETRAEGASGLATSFLASGVPAVLATLWPVDDRASARLLATFHRGLAAGMPAANALQAAQLEGLSADSGVFSTWAAYQLLGATE